MRQIVSCLFLLLFVSCSEEKYTLIGQDIIEGKISAIEKKYRGIYSDTPSKIWVQSPTMTKELTIPYDYEYKKRWKVGDSCVLVIQKYRTKK